MKITRLKLSNLFSFDDFSLKDLDCGVNIIVGPNGSGKTNLVRALKLAKDVIEYRVRNVDFQSLLHDSSKSVSFKIEIEIELDKSELDILRDYIRTYVGKSRNAKIVSLNTHAYTTYLK